MKQRTEKKETFSWNTKTLKMATSQELLHIDSETECSPFLINSKKHSKDKMAQQKQQPPRITRIEASSVLSRAKNFIPMLVNANHQLQKDMKETSAEKFDIENVDQDEKFIEMNIGIFAREYKETDSSSSDESDSSNTDEDFLAAMLGEVTEDNLKLSKNQEETSNLITEMETGCSSESTKTCIGTELNGDKNTTKVSRKVNGVAKKQRLKKKKRRNGKTMKF